MEGGGGEGGERLMLRNLFSSLLSISVSWLGGLADLLGHLLALLAGNVLTLLSWDVGTLLGRNIATLLAWDVVALLSGNVGTFLPWHLSGDIVTLLAGHILA